LSLDFLRSGGVYYGGFLGGLFAVVLLVRLYKLPFWKVSDAFAPGLALGQAFGRQGCFSAGCCWGKPTTLPWGVHFTEAGNAYTGVPLKVNQLQDPAQQSFWAEKLGGSDASLHLHPTQLYESFIMLAVFGLLFYLHRHKKFDGQVFIAYGIIYSIVRFSIEFIRDDPRGDLLGFTSLTGLSTSQGISLIVAVASIVFMIMRHRRAAGSSPEIPSE
jgi:phosphatidylglycerol:prolipoprotein diacylglycerol transferase